MQAVILAGGYGTRLWPVTEHRPKMLLPVGERTVLDSILKPLQQDGRIDRVYISTNDRFDDRLRTFVHSSGYSKSRLSVEPTKHESEKPGAVRALADFINRENISDDLLVIAGDHYVDFDLSAFVSFFESVQAPAITANDVGSKKKASSYGVIEVREEQVVNFVEKPDEPDSTLISPACYAFPAETLSEFDMYLAADTDPDAPGWFIQWLKDRTPVYAYIIEGTVIDVGTRSNYLNAVEQALNGATLISDEASIRETTFGQNVIIKDNATVHGSFVTDSVIFSGARMINSEVNKSIVDKGATLEDITLNEELVGEGEHPH